MCVYFEPLVRNMIMLQSLLESSGYWWARTELALILRAILQQQGHSVHANSSSCNMALGSTGLLQKSVPGVIMWVKGGWRVRLATSAPSVSKT
jgi:hypothetical protein